MSLTRRTAVKGALAAGLACPAVPGAAQVRAPGASVLRFVPEFDLKGMDPVVNTGLATLQHAYMVYDTLYAMDGAFRPRPQMVGAFEVADDGLAYLFRLRKGLRFHDGTAVTARDCTASIRRWGARDVMGRLLMERTAALDALDGDSFRLTLSEPFPPTIEALAKISSSPCFVMREKEAASDPHAPVTEAVGSGPFRFLRDEFVPGALVAYAAHAAYVPRPDAPDGYAGAKRAGVDRVEWRVIPDPATRAGAILGGEVDIISAVPPELLPLLRRDPALRVDLLDRRGWLAYVRPNHLFPPFSDVRARRALAHLVDQAEYMAAAAGGQEGWQGCWSFLACGPDAADAGGMDAYGKPDLARARELLAAAGYRGEPLVVLHPVDDAILGNVTALTIAQLRKVGVAVQPVAADLATVLARRASTQPPEAGGRHLFHGRSLGLELGNPLTNFPLASPCRDGAPDVRAGWFGWPCDAGVEALRRQWLRAPDDPERRRVARLLQHEAARSLPFVPLGQIHAPVVYRKAVRHLVRMPVPVLWNASVAA